jgi:UDP-N-acetylmuramoyl-L-alanyl-D-glutamate--2,6-diaminopimelate ligase
MRGASGQGHIAPRGDPDILGLTSDSRAVKPGYLFAALSGRSADGRRFLDDAVKRGAGAVLADRPVELPVPVVVDANPRRCLALMAALYYAPQPATVAAVTGTNGKTSVAAFLRQIWQSAGLKAASLGTTGIVGPGIEKPGSLTTPDPVELHKELQELARMDVDHLALEASSHGLDQFRLDGVKLAAAGFTNLTRDHLDYHPDMAAYFTAKTRLFAELLPRDGAAVIAIDQREGVELAELCRGRGIKTVTYGRAERAELRLVRAEPKDAGIGIEISLAGQRHGLDLPLLGGFQAMNALCALGLALVTGIKAEVGLGALRQLRGAPGRMEDVATHSSGAKVIVDYAHSPDALETALKALRPHGRGRLVLVFGCGGDRDKGKRPLMGAIAQRLADLVFVTDDNPRSENPAEIRRAILAACPKAREIADRREAIRTAAALLRKGDLLLIAGKGHESGQIVGSKTLPFSDKDEARAAIAALAGGGV